MKKAAWISFCGWAALACASFWFASFLLGLHAEPGGQPHPSELSMIPFLLFWPCAALWLLGSIVYRVRLSGAKMQADVLMDAAKKAGIAVPVMPGPGAPPRAIATAVNHCAECTQLVAVVRCVVDGTFLCANCWPAHDAREHKGGGLSAARVGR